MRLLQSRKARYSALLVGVLALVAAPVAFATGEGKNFILGKRNPSSGGLTKESQVIANIAQGQGGIGANTGGFSTRQSNLSSSGGGAIYGCRATAGTEACIASNNLANGDAFRFQVSPNANEGGVIRFGTNLASLVNKPPFVTNGTGTVTNLSADMLDGQDASDFLTNTNAANTYLTKTQANQDFVTKTQANQDFAASNIAPYAVVSSTGSITHGNFTTGSATPAASGANTQFTVTFTRSVNACAATTTPTSNPTTSEMYATASGSTVTVTETGVAPAAAYGFNLTVLCGGN
jgi:hypothetical protein